MLSRVFRGVILGAPASGKGTISKRIVQKYDFVHIAPGDILRLNVANNTELGKKVKVYIDKGQLVPDDIVMHSVMEHLKTAEQKPWMLDGFPRTVVQAENLQKSIQIDAVLNLNVPNEVIIERTKGRWIHLASGRVYNIGFNDPKVPGKDDITGEPLMQRTDDLPEVVAKRLEVYSQMMQPVLDFYMQHNLVTHFNGKTTAEIWPQVETFLNKKLQELKLEK